MGILCKTLIVVVLLILTYPYAYAPLSTIRPVHRFVGTEWFNPYSSVHTRWIKANVHLHSHAWWGLTDGRSNTISAIDSTYRNLGVDLIALSNYHRIDVIGPKWLHLPCYEHGYNIQKTHQLAFGARNVVMLDCILPQTISIKQWILDILRPTTDVLILAHPAFGRPSYDTVDLTVLSNYNCIEVFNHYRISLAHWDSALSNGIIAWAVGNDDCHNVASDDETGVCLTLVNVPDNPTPQDIYRSYRDGRTIAVKTRHAKLPLGVPYQRITGDSLIVSFDGIADSVRFICDYGQIIARSTSGSRAIIHLPTDVSYIRLEVYKDSTVYALNPVVRTDSETPLQIRRLVVDNARTFLNRTVWFLLYIAIGVHLFRRRTAR